mmetsp:Transcript_7007/g.21328  ORF Transcript_7007/g.21328 Transcript_7007/m.21328 type:complete len:259 (+) Transcript_7007:213-989(+)
MAFVGASSFVVRRGCELAVEKRVLSRGGVSMRASPYGGFLRMLSDLAKGPNTGSVSGRTTKMSVAEKHAVLGTPMDADFAAMGMKTAMFGLGCFWGAERKFWQTNGVYSTAVGYAGGKTENPSYKEVCTGKTEHAEVVRVIYDPEKISFKELLNVFWASHDPTTPNRQGNDVGTQYRSVVYYTTPEEKEDIEETRQHYDKLLEKKGYGKVVTEVTEMPKFYFAEDYHQQYLHKNPWGYCGLGGLGVYEKPRESVETSN